MGPRDRAPSSERRTEWLIDGNNVFGSRPDGWWNDRAKAMTRFGQRVALWCRTHDSRVIVVFDQPVPDEVLRLGGGNLSVIGARRAGRNGADHTVVELADDLVESDPGSHIVVVSSDKGLRDRLPSSVATMGVGRFRDLIDY